MSPNVVRDFADRITEGSGEGATILDSPGGLWATTSMSLSEGGRGIFGTGEEEGDGMTEAGREKVM